MQKYPEGTSEDLIKTKIKAKLLRDKVATQVKGETAQQIWEHF